MENKTQPSLCLQTWLQQNLRISTNHKYRIYVHGCFFATGRFEDLTFCNLTFCKPDVLKPDVLWVYPRLWLSVVFMDIYE